MGNGQTKTVQQAIIAKKKKSFSFDVGDFNNFNMDKIKPTNVSMMMNNLNNNNNHHISSSLDMKASNSKNNNNDSHIIMPSLMNRQLSSIIQTVKPHKMSLKQQNAKLQKLNRNNDQLRKQLIEINQKLALQLQKKKVKKIVNGNNNNNNGNNNNNNGSNNNNKNKQRSLSSSYSSKTQPKKSSSSQQQIPKQNNKYKTMALKKQLQNAYNQISIYKKQLQTLKKNDSSQANTKLFQYDDKITLIDQEINTVQKSITSTRDIVDKQRVAIGQFQSEMGGSGVQEMKREIVLLKERLRQIKQVSRRKQKDEKMRHQLLIQMERKLREINGQYMPEFKNWGMQVPQGIRQSRISSTTVVKSRMKTKGKDISNNKDYKYSEQNNLLTTNSPPQPPPQPSPPPPPTTKQIQQLLTQHQSHKKTHQQMNRKIYLQIKKKNEYKQQRQKILQKLQMIQKNIQNMNYKKERYMQVIIGNEELMTSIGAG